MNGDARQRRAIKLQEPERFCSLNARCRYRQPFATQHPRGDALGRADGAAMALPTGPLRQVEQRVPPIPTMDREGSYIRE